MADDSYINRVRVLLQRASDLLEIFGERERAFALLNKCLDILDEGDISIVESRRPKRLRADILNLRAAIYNKNGNYVFAITDYNKAIELYPESIELYYRRALAYVNEGEYDRAIKDYDRVIVEHPKNANYYSARGLAYSKKGNYTRAIDDLSEAIFIASEKADYYFDRGKVHYDNGKYHLAIKDFDAAISLSSVNADYYFYRGLVYSEEEEYNDAIENFDEAIRKSPKVAKYYSHQGEAYNNKGEHSNAIFHFNKAIELDDKYIPAYQGRAIAIAQREIQIFAEAFRSELRIQLGDIKEQTELQEKTQQEKQELLLREEVKKQLDAQAGDSRRALEKVQEENQKSISKFEEEFKKKLEEQETKLKSILEGQLKDAENQTKVFDEYEAQEELIKELLEGKESAEGEMEKWWQLWKQSTSSERGKEKELRFYTARAQAFLLFGFIVIAAIIGWVAHPSITGEKHMPASTVFLAYLLLGGFFASSYVILSELRRKRAEVLQLRAAHQDAFRKKNMAQYPILFLGDKEKRFALASQFLDHMADRSPAEFTLDWQEKEAKSFRKKDDSPTRSEVIEIIEQALKAAEARSGGGGGDLPPPAGN